MHEGSCFKNHLVLSVGAKFTVGNLKSPLMLSVTVQYMRVCDQKQSSHARCWHPEHEIKISCRAQCWALYTRVVSPKTSSRAQWWRQVNGRQSKIPLVPSAMVHHISVGDRKQSSHAQCSSQVKNTRLKNHVVLSVGHSTRGSFLLKSCRAQYWCQVYGRQPKKSSHAQCYGTVHIGLRSKTIP